jgi:hypothetical protein
MPIEVYAALSKETYYVANKDAMGSLPSGWKTIFVAAPKGKWGNCYAIFANQEAQEVILSIRGTDNIFNLLTDVGLVVSNFKGEPFLPPGQEDVEKCAHSFTQFQSDFDFGEIIKDFTILESSVGGMLTSWHLTLLSIAATTYGVHETLGFAGFKEISAIIKEPCAGNMAVGQPKLELARRYLEDKEKGIRKYLKGNPHVTSHFDNIKSNLNKSSFKNYQFKVIGHSLGAVMAELCSTRLGIECITFESPGSLNLIKGLPNYDKAHCKLIKNYLSAPNIINTLNPHPGILYRMYLPHTEGFDGVHAASCVLNSAFRVSTYLTVGSMSAAMAFTKQVALETAKTVAKGSALTSCVTKLSGGIFALWGDKRWLEKQHSIEKISQFLQGNGVVSRMESWPKFSDGLKESRFVALGRDFLPLQKDRPGIRNFFDEDGMREAQIERIPGYRMHSDLDFDSEDLSSDLDLSFDLDLSSDLDCAAKEISRPVTPEQKNPPMLTQFHLHHQPATSAPKAPSNQPIKNKRKNKANRKKLVKTD